MAAAANQDAEALKRALDNARTWRAIDTEIRHFDPPMDLGDSVVLDAFRKDGVILTVTAVETDDPPPKRLNLAARAQAGSQRNPMSWTVPTTTAGRAMQFQAAFLDNEVEHPKPPEDGGPQPAPRMEPALQEPPLPDRAQPERDPEDEDPPAPKRRRESEDSTSSAKRLSLAAPAEMFSRPSSVIDLSASEQRVPAIIRSALDAMTPDSGTHYHPAEATVQALSTTGESAHFRSRFDEILVRWGVQLDRGTHEAATRDCEPATRKASPWDPDSQPTVLYETPSETHSGSVPQAILASLAYVAALAKRAGAPALMMLDMEAIVRFIESTFSPSISLPPAARENALRVMYQFASTLCTRGTRPSFDRAFEAPPSNVRVGFSDMARAADATISHTLSNLNAYVGDTSFSERSTLQAMAGVGAGLARMIQYLRPSTEERMSLSLSNVLGSVPFTATVLRSADRFATHWRPPLTPPARTRGTGPPDGHSSYTPRASASEPPGTDHHHPPEHLRRPSEQQKQRKKKRDFKGQGRGERKPAARAHDGDNA
jgi:hypothetical protein